MAMIHATRAPGETTLRFEFAEAEAEGEGVVLEVGNGEIIRVVFGTSLV